MRTLEMLFDEHLIFTKRTFPEATAIGALKHAAKELVEIENEIIKNAPLENIAEEFADLIGCIIDSANRSGVNPELLIASFDKKLERNKRRDWKYNGDGSYSHVKRIVKDKIILSCPHLCDIHGWEDGTTVSLRIERCIGIKDKNGLEPYVFSAKHNRDIFISENEYKPIYHED